MRNLAPVFFGNGRTGGNVAYKSSGGITFTVEDMLKRVHVCSKWLLENGTNATDQEINARQVGDKCYMWSLQTADTDIESKQVTVVASFPQGKYTVVDGDDNIITANEHGLQNAIYYEHVRWPAHPLQLQEKIAVRRMCTVLREFVRIQKARRAEEEVERAEVERAETECEGAKVLQALARCHLENSTLRKLQMKIIHEKGDNVMVQYEHQWVRGTITKRTMFAFKDATYWVFISDPSYATGCLLKTVSIHAYD